MVVHSLILRLIDGNREKKHCIWIDTISQVLDFSRTYNYNGIQLNNDSIVVNIYDYYLGILMQRQAPKRSMTHLQFKTQFC